MRFFFLAFFSFISCLLFAQIKYPVNYFMSPLAGKNTISSNFCEIRPNHFHTGFDYQTKLKAGINIYAVGDGFISRIKVSPRGYGNTVYITHPNGFVSVYAHLSKFDSRISEYVSKIQHDTQQFEFDNFLYPGAYPVKKGQIIGKSGNSGSSYGAHLHFELRDAITEEPINPLFFNFHLTDTQAPRILGLYVYQFNPDYKDFKFVQKEFYKNMSDLKINAFGPIGFGVEIHDYMLKGSRIKFGVYQIELFIDDSLVYSNKMERISFDEARYINSFIDYEVYREKGIKVSKCYVEPNNKLRIYQTKGNGIYDFSDGKLHRVKIVGTDFKGNAGSFDFYVQSDSSIAIPEPAKGMSVQEINCRRANEYSTDSFHISFPENTFFYNFYFKYSYSKVGLRNYSDYHHIHNQYVPLNNNAHISIKPFPIPENLKNKALIVGIDRYHRLYSAGGNWNGDYIETDIDEFGTYYVTVDTICPTIEPISLKKSNILISNWLHFEIEDNLSGIADYYAYIDDSWVLFTYDEKNKLISCYLPSENILKGEHNLVIWVRDKLGNIGTFESKFIY
jgi:hypothetical protein